MRRSKQRGEDEEEEDEEDGDDVEDDEEDALLWLIDGGRAFKQRCTV